MSERALVLLKPDCVRRELVESVLLRLTDAGLRILHRERTILREGEVERLYKKHRSDLTYQRLMDHMLSGPCEVLVVEGPACIAMLRRIKGRTGSGNGIRGELAEDFIRNLIHTPDTVLQAHSEIAQFLPLLAQLAPHPRIIFGLSGPSESGKSTAGMYLQECGVLRLKLIQLLESVRRKLWPQEGDTGTWVRRMLIEEPITLQMVLGDAVSEAFDTSEAWACALESLGDPETVLYLRRRFDSEFVQLYIDAPVDDRVARQMRVLALGSIEEAQRVISARDEEKEVLWRMSEMKELADEVLVNDGELETFLKDLDRMLTRYRPTVS